MKNRLYVAGCLLIASSVASAAELSHAKPEEVGMSSEKLGELDDIIQEYIDAGRVNGVVVGVTRRNKVVYHAAHGVLNPLTKEPMPKDAMFAMASSTKPILGVAAMMAIEEGLMSPEDPVEKYLPEFKGMQVAVPVQTDKEKESKNTKSDKGDSKKYDEEWLAKNWDSLSDEKKAEVVAYYEDMEKNAKPVEVDLVAASRPITIHDLLTHTAGLHTGGPGTAGSSLERSETETLASFAPRAAEEPLDFQPGTKWAYSGTVGLDIVARIIEIVSEQPFNEFVQERIFDPLDMRDTHWNLPEGKEHRVPVDPNSKGRYIKSPYYFSGSVGLLSTARDYMHFEQMLVNKGTLFGRQLLKPETVEMMTSNKVGKLFDKSGKGVSGLGMGYTVGINLDPELSKDPRPAGAFGWGGAAGTVSWSAPSEDLTFVYMVMGPTDLPGKLAAVVTEAIVD